MSLISAHIMPNTTSKVPATIWDFSVASRLLLYITMVTPYTLQYQVNQIRIELVVRLPEYSTTKPPEKSNFQPLATRLLSIPQAAKLSSNNRHVSSHRNRSRDSKRNDNHVPQIREAKKKWPSRNGLCIATRRMTRIVQRKKRVYGLIVPWRIPGSTEPPTDRIVRTQPVPFI